MGLSNNRLKFLQSLQNRKFRRKYGYFLVEGEKAVKEFCEGSLFEVEEVFTCKGFLVEDLQTDFEVHLLSEKEMARVSAFSTPSPAACLMRMKEFTAKDIRAHSGWQLAVDRLNDPGNLGSILRIADWYGLNQLIIGSGSVDPYNPKVVSASMGSLSRVMPIQAALSEVLQACQVPIMAATLDGLDVKEVQQTQGMIIIGSESHGISEDVLKQCDQQVSIGRLGQAESLNAAVAAGIICERLIRR